MKLLIELDQHKTTFVPGQHVLGHVSLFDATTVNTLRVKFQGKVETTIMGHERLVILFQDQLHIIKEQVTLEDQVSVYPFNFRLPPTQLPPTFDSFYARIEYSIEAFAINSLYEKCSFQLPITVPCSLDPRNECYADPVTIQKQHRVGLAISSNGFFIASCSIPKQAFASEEIIPLSIDITNHSNFSVIIKQITLKQQVQYGSFAKYSF
jgi:hypothetical protein